MREKVSTFRELTTVIPDVSIDFQRVLSILEKNFEEESANLLKVMFEVEKY